MGIYRDPHLHEYKNQGNIQKYTNGKIKLPVLENKKDT